MELKEVEVRSSTRRWRATILRFPGVSDNAVRGHPFKKSEADWHEQCVDLP
jgi:hypothetical protein